jgi:DNA-directed RNA polymerase specialized sigma24 family protein
MAVAEVTPKKTQRPVENDTQLRRRVSDNRPMSTGESVTQWIGQLQAEAAQVRHGSAEQIWRRYSERLLKLARRHLRAGVRRRADEEDVLQSAFKSFFLRQQRGDFQLHDRDDLWSVLLMITLRKVRNAGKREQRQRRDYRREQAPVGDVGTPRDEGVELLAARQAGPDAPMMLRDEMLRRLRMLPTPLLQIALWKLWGYSNDQIAGPKMLDCAERTVRRKLERIQRLWERES